MIPEPDIADPDDPRSHRAFTRSGPATVPAPAGPAPRRSGPGPRVPNPVEMQLRGRGRSISPAEAHLDGDGAGPDGPATVPPVEAEVADDAIAQLQPCVRCSTDALLRIVGRCADCISDMGRNHPDERVIWKQEVTASIEGRSE